jgi:hypothetical protein
VAREVGIEVGSKLVREARGLVGPGILRASRIVARDRWLVLEHAV